MTVCIYVTLGMRESAVNRAEGLRQSKILTSEAVRIEQVNQAKGEASAILARATARASALLTLGKALGAKVSQTLLSFLVMDFSFSGMLSMGQVQRHWQWQSSMYRPLGSWLRLGTLFFYQRRLEMLAQWWLRYCTDWVLFSALPVMGVLCRQWLSTAR